MHFYGKLLCSATFCASNCIQCYILHIKCYWMLHSVHQTAIQCYILCIKLLFSATFCASNCYSVVHSVHQTVIQCYILCIKLLFSATFCASNGIQCYILCIKLLFSATFCTSNCHSVLHSVHQIHSIYKFDFVKVYVNRLVSCSPPVSCLCFGGWVGR